MAGHYSCFISYASEDEALADRLYRQLTARGLKTWFDRARLAPGCDWYQEIENGLLASDLVIPILTPNWQMKDWTRFETYGAPKILPLLVVKPGVEPRDIARQVTPPPLHRWQHFPIDLVNANAADFDLLAEAIVARLEGAGDARLAFETNIPFARNAYFVGREHELVTICEALHQAPTTLMGQGGIRALTSLGGVGKTTLASEYVHRFWRIYRQIFWVDAQQGLEAQFASLLYLVDPLRALAAESDAERAALALASLRGRAERLLVIDNADDEESVQAWLPQGGGCHVLITSRFTGWSAAVRTLSLDVLDPEKARTFLQSRTGRYGEDETNACDGLASRLGYLPLALEQAGAYMVAEGPDFSFDGCNRLYDRTAATLLAAGALGSTHYPDPVITTWAATVQRLSLEARAILRVIAYMGGKRIPIAMFEQFPEAVLEVAQGFGRIEPPGENDGLRVRAAIRALAAYSMARSTGAEIAVHNLVQTVERLEAEPDSAELAIHAGFACVHRFFPPNDHAHRELAAILTEHVLTLNGWATQESLWQAQALQNAGDDLAKRAAYAAAEPLLRKSVEIWRHLGEPGDVMLAPHLTSLALPLQAVNQRAEAIALLREAIGLLEAGGEGAERDLIDALHCLSLLLMGLNELEEAEALLARALAIAEKAIAPNDLQFLSLLDGLGMLHLTSGRIEATEQLYQRVLEALEAFPQNDPNIGLIKGNFGQYLMAAGRPQDAIHYLLAARETLETELSGNHPSVGTVHNNLGMAMSALARPAEAEALFKSAIEIWEKGLGPNNARLGTAIGNLGYFLLTNEGDQAEAETCLRRALKIAKRNYGPRHPNFISALNNLSELLLQKGETRQAEQCLRWIITTARRDKTIKDADISKTMSSLGAMLRDAERFAEAETMLTDALALQETSQGPRHLDLTTTLHNIASLYDETGRPEAADATFRRALAIREEHLPPDHVDVADGFHVYGGFLVRHGRFADARDYYRAALRIRDEGRFGPREALDNVVHNLAYVHARLDELDEAEALFRRAIAHEEQRHGADSLGLVPSLREFAGTLRRLGRDAEAMLQTRRAFAICAEKLGPDDPLTLALAEALGETAPR